MDTESPRTKKHLTFHHSCTWSFFFPSPRTTNSVSAISSEMTSMSCENLWQNTMPIKGQPGQVTQMTKVVKRMQGGRDKKGKDGGSV